MKAWLCENPIGVDTLQWKEVPTPEPKAGEVRIAVRAASLNFPDLLIVQNKYQFKPPLPFVPGAEYSGTVDAVGSGVTHLTVGQPVAAIAGVGGFGTHAVVNAAQVEQVLFGDGGAADTLRPGSVFVMCSTVAPAWSMDLEKRLAERGVHYLDAPISGGAARNPAPGAGQAH